MADVGQPGWIDAASAAAVRLAAESGTDVDDILEHGATPDARTFHADRLEHSAELPEVAADLAGLLWAEGTDVPPIATILEEPAAQASLEAVAEARRQAASRLTGRVEPILPTERTPPVIVVAAPTPERPASEAGPASRPPQPAIAPVVAPAGPNLAPELRHRPGATLLAGGAAVAILLFGRRFRRA